jgi:hypothetical protein
MTNFADWSVRLYGRILLLYPDDLCRDYGAEMILAFRDDMESARRDAGVRGVLRVWRCTLSEVMRLAVPAHLASPAVLVPAMEFAFTLATISFEMMLALRHAHPSASAFFHAIMPAFPLLSFVTPVIALGAVWICHGTETLSLGLCDPPHRER